MVLRVCIAPVHVCGVVLFQRTNIDRVCTRARTPANYVCGCM
eukprot:COSAG01_NODE_4131_length_5322_cov_26.056672_5_plen_42_part_00